MSSVYHDGWFRRYISSIWTGKSWKNGIEFLGGEGGRDGLFMLRYSCDGLRLDGDGNSNMKRMKE
jgi:hypothetical protein